ncbi:MAG: hypothetical protein PHE78_03280 [Candidatus Gastranaerophilales bacterium]|jgi:hypothetical protein|nr:hypothetical protein [Candidatus Gastranaerophilales bacterium]
MNEIEKLQEAKNIIESLEAELLETKGFCPYEIGFVINRIDDAIKFFEDTQT